MARTYAVEPNWPNRPRNSEWGGMSGVGVDVDDRIYLVNRNYPHVQIYAVDGSLIALWDKVSIQRAHHLTVAPDGHVWIADDRNHVVQKFTPDGDLLITLGTPGVPGCDGEHFNLPTDIAVTLEGDLFVSDGYGNHRVVHLDAAGQFIGDWGSAGNAPGQFVLPHAVAVDSGRRVYVADRNGGRIEIFDDEGQLLDVWAERIIPWGLFVDGDDALWVCGSSCRRVPDGNSYQVTPPPDQIVLKLTSGGETLGRWEFPVGADGDRSPGKLNWVHCIAVDSAENLYLGDVRGNRLQKFA